ncbi:nSTAND1 domain-containing NTPase [Intrasporangium oryzae]|nr:hypothetical protein [Intrasporangium oryzae]
MSTDLSAAVHSETSLSECPYRGLQPYGEEDEEYYFGRDADRDLVIANLMASRLTVLYGPSGVGKSSLLRAGVVSRLRRMPDSAFSYLAVGHAVVVYHATWREDPLSGLGTAVRESIPAKLKPPDFVAPEGPLSLELLREVSTALDADIYLLLDQFEEESLYVAPDEAESLAIELGRIVSAQGLRVSVLIGVREDALAKLDSLEAHVPGLFANNLRLDHLGAASARRAIEQPLARYNVGRPTEQQVSIEPSLVDELLQQLRTGHLSVAESGAGGRDESAVTIETPFLQLVMTRLWGEERSRGSRVLRESTLHELGDAERIVRTHLDHVMGQLTDAQRDTAAAVFRYLVTPSGMKIAHTAADLAEYAGLDPSALIALTEELASGSERILRPVEPPVDRPGAPRYEIFHDVLAPAVLDWRRRYVDEKEREAAERSLVEQRQEAERLHRETTQRLRRSRLVSAALLVFLLVAVYAVVDSRRSRDAANAASTAANSATTLSDAMERLASDPATALGLAVKARDMVRNAATESAVRVALDADRQRLRVRADNGTVNVAAFSPDGTAFVTGGSDGVAKLFDAGTGRQVRVFGAPQSTGSTAPPSVGDGLVPGTTSTTHPTRGEITAVSFSKDGTLLAVTSGAPETSVYAVDTGRNVLKVEGYVYYMTAVWGARKGEPVLYTGGYGKPAQAWLAGVGTRLATFGKDGTDSASLDLSADGSRLVTAGSGRATVYDTRTGRALKETIAGPTDIADVAFAGKGSDTVAMWSHPHGEPWSFGLWTWQTSTSPKAMNRAARAPSEIVVSADGSRVATVFGKGVEIFDVASGTELNRLPDQPDLLTAVRFSQDGEHDVTAGVGGQALVWRVGAVDLAPVDRLLGHAGAISDVRYSPKDPGLVLTTGWDGSARLWELTPRTVVAEVDTWMQGADISPDGSEIVSVSDSGEVQISDRASGKLTSEEWADSELGKYDYLRVAWLPDGKRAVLSTSADSAPRIWDRNGSTDARVLEFDDQLTYGLAVDPTGQTVAMGDQRNRLVIWDVESGKITARLSGGDTSHHVFDVTFVPHTSLVAGASTDGVVRLWDLSQRTARPRTLGSPGSAPLTAVTSSADGAWIAAATTSNLIRIYRVKDGTLVREIQGPTTYLGDLAFSPDASLVAVAAGDGAVHVWDRATGELRAVLHRHGGAVNTVEFTKDGKQLVTASDDGTTAIFACTTCGAFDSVMEAARARVAARSNNSMVPMEKRSDATALGQPAQATG